MGLLSTGIGAGIGWAIGGPIGAGIGAFIGSMLGNDDDGTFMVNCRHCGKYVEVESKENWTCPHCKRSSTEEKLEEKPEGKQAIFLVTLCAMLAKMANADGKVSKDELFVILEFFDIIGFDSEDKQIAIKIFNHAKNDDASIYTYAERYAAIADYEMREMMYAILWDVANADGKIHQNENDILIRIPHHLKIPESLYYQYHHKYQMQQDDLSLDIDECYKILNCTENDTDQTIKKKYRKAVSEYHPDKIQAKGLPEGFIRFANEQVQKINLAYETILEHRNQ